MSDDAICPNCKRNTELVFDRSSGHAICSECGLVLVLEFTNESADIHPVRGLSWSSLARLHNRGTTNLDRSLILAFKTIATMCDRLGLVPTIKDRAFEIFKKVEDHQKKSIRSGRNQDATLAACLYIACRQENKPRTVKEIFSAANGATKTDIRRVIKQLELQMGQSVAMRKLHAGDFMRRFCSNLCLANQTAKAAQESVQKLQEFDIRRSAVSIAAGIIYIVTQLSDEKKPLKDVALATGVVQGTVRNAYKDLYPHLTKIIPTWYAQEQDIKNLSRPLNSHIVI